MAEYNTVRNFVVGMVEGLYPRFSDRDVMLSMKLNFSFSYYNEKEDDDEIYYKKKFQVVFHRPSNYTKVFLKEINSLDDEYGEKFKLLSDHDSGWREDGMRWIPKTIFSAYEFFENKGISRLDVSSWISFSLDGYPTFKKVEKFELNDREAIIKFSNKPIEVKLVEKGE